MTSSAASSYQPLVLRAPAPYLFCVPSLAIAASITLFSRVLPAVVESCSAECSDVSSAFPLVQSACFFSAFFKQCLATDSSRAFIGTMLAFVSALLTISHVEASRLVNQESPVLTRPAWIWTAVNAITGAVVSPIVLCANIIRRRNAEQARLTSTSNEAHPLMPDSSSSSSPPSPAFLANHDRQLLSSQRTYAIPVAISLGFVLPSLILLANPSPLVAGLWNFFPLAIYAVHALTHRLISGDGQHQHHHAERHLGSTVRIYAIPVALSLLAHGYLIGCWIRGAQSEWNPPTKLMLINFCAIISTYLYWLLIESSLSTVAITVLVGCIAGPGAGISVGWVLKELSMQQGPTWLDTYVSWW